MMKSFFFSLLSALAFSIAGCYKLSYSPAADAPLAVRGPYFMDTTQTLEVRNVGPEINTYQPEYSPFVKAEGKVLYFTKKQGLQGYHDIFAAVKKWAADTLWESIKALPSPINSSLNEGALTISADDNAVVFSACNRSDGLGDCDLYAVLDPDLESPEVANLARFNSSYWESAPAFTSDGKTIYFVSNRPGTLGGPEDTDIYVSFMQEDGRWTEPENLGAPVNSPHRQSSPFIGPGDSLLYFASDDPGGYGGQDIYVSGRRPNGTWGEPRNLGWPVNTPADEIYFSSTGDGFVSYVCSNRKDIRNYGQYDIYMIRFVP